MHSQELPFSLDGASSRKNLMSKEFKGIGLGLIEVNRRGFFCLSQFMTTFIIKFVPWLIRMPTGGA